MQAFHLAIRFRDHLAAAPIGFDGPSRAPTGVMLQTDDGARPGPQRVNNANHVHAAGRHVHR